MMIYLCETYPDAYTYRSKFGDVLYDKNKDVTIIRAKVVTQLVSLFTCNQWDAYHVFDNWKLSRPVYVRVLNSTNETVYIPLEIKCNATVLDISY